MSKPPEDFEAQFQDRPQGDLVVREYVWITPKQLGAKDYQAFCHRSGLKFIDKGYGGLLVEDAQGDRWTLLTTDLRFHARTIDSLRAADTGRFETNQYSIQRRGWPDEWDAQLRLEDPNTLADGLALCYSLAGGNGPEDTVAEHIEARYTVSGQHGGPGVSELLEGVAQVVTWVASILSATHNGTVPLKAEVGTSPTEVLHTLMLAHAQRPPTPES